MEMKILIPDRFYPVIKDNTIHFVDAKEREAIQKVERIERNVVLNKEKEWKDFGIVDGYYVNDASITIKTDNVNIELSSSKEHRNIFPSEKEAEVYGIVLPQLLQWRDRVNGDWKPDWNNRKQTKWSIIQKANKITVATYYTTYTPLTFETGQKAEQFYKDHKTLVDSMII